MRAVTGVALYNIRCGDPRHNRKISENGASVVTFRIIRCVSNLGFHIYPQECVLEHHIGMPIRGTTYFRNMNGGIPPPGALLVTASQISWDISNVSFPSPREALASEFPWVQQPASNFVWFLKLPPQDICPVSWNCSISRVNDRYPPMWSAHGGTSIDTCDFNANRWVGRCTSICR